jgi:ADP-ribose pyrophosphatase YjhB (NUDIX family)
VVLKNAPMRGRWSLPGGRVQGGERIRDAVAREVLEETGLTVSVGDLLEVFESITEGFHYVVHDHLCAPHPSDQVPRAGDDAEQARYVPVSDLRSFGVTEDVIRVVGKAIAIREGS